jgi:hypothetical protein
MPIFIAAIIPGGRGRVNFKDTGEKRRAARRALTPLSAYVTVAKICVDKPEEAV